MRWSLAGTLVNRGLTVLCLVGLARTVGIAPFGVWAFAATTAGLIATLSSLGMHLDAQRAINGASVSADGRRRVQIVVIALGLAGVLGGVLGGWITSWFEVSRDIPFASWITIITVLGVALAANNFAHRLLIARERVASAFLATDGLRNCLTVVIAFLLDVNAQQLLWTFAAVATAVALISWMLVVALEPSVIFGSRSRLLARVAMRSGSGVLAVSVLFYMRRQGDVLVLAAVLADAQYAIYFAAARLANMVALGMASLSGPLGPRIGAQFTSERVSETQEMISNITAKSVGLAGIALVVLAVFGGLLLEAFGPSFIEGRWTLILLASGIFVQAAVGPTGMILQYCGRAWTCAGIEGLSALLGLPLLWPCGHKLGHQRCRDSRCWYHSTLLLHGGQSCP